MDPLLAQITLFAGNFPPRGWAFCNGQLLPIAQHHALFALLGTTYGGNGTTTFALPDLRGRVPVHAGAAPDLPAVQLGEAGGWVTAPSGDGPQPGQDVAPYLGVSFIIALQGIFPARDDG